MRFDVRTENSLLPRRPVSSVLKFIIPTIFRQNPPQHVDSQTTAPRLPTQPTSKRVKKPIRQALSRTPQADEQVMPSGFAASRAKLILLVFLTGCALRPSAPNLQPTSHSGSVRGGQQPISGATIQLYAVGTTSDGSAATPLLTQAVTSDTNGSFTITGLYTCSTADQLYITATGGSPGLGSGATNPNAVLMAAVGPCSKLTPSLFITINEVTTVAAAYALEPYMASASAIGASSTDTSILASAFTLAAQLASLTSGSSPGNGAPLGFSVPVAQINTIANILATCINSPGGIAGDGSPCGTFFALTTPPSGPAPTDTVSALLNLARNPTLNTAALFNLATPTSVFQPADSSSPSDLSVALIPAVATALLPGANVQIPFIEGTGTVAHDLSGNHNDCTFAPGQNAPAWTSAGIDHLSPGHDNSTPRFCSFPASTSRTDKSATNSRTKIWCGYLRPIAYGMANVYYSILIGSSHETGIGAIWMSGNNLVNGAYYAGSYAGGGIPTATDQSIVGWHCVTMTLGSNTDATLDHFYYDQAEIPSYVRQNRSWDFRALGDYDVLGATPWLAQGFFEGITSYLLEYPTVLTPAQIASNVQSIQAIAFTARGVGGTPPQSTSTISQILCNGDSITNETPNAISYCNELIGLNQTFNISNIAHGGSTQSTMVSNIPLAEGVLFAPRAPFSFASMAGGINDININAASAAAVVAKRVLWAQQVAAIGWKPLWLTMPSSLNNDATVQAVNASLRAQAAALGVTLVDVATDSCLGATGAYANPPGCNHFTDGIHPNQTGEDAIRKYYVNIINYLSGSTMAAPTVVSSPTYQVQAADAFISVIPSGPGSALTLPSCIAFSTTTPFVITNASSSTSVTVSAPQGQAISIPIHVSLTFTSTPLSPTTAGCIWTAQ